MKMPARSGYRHIEKPALLVDLFGFAACHIRRNTAIDEVENEDGVPFLPLGRMNGRQDQIVLVDHRAGPMSARSKNARGWGSQQRSARAGRGLRRAPPHNRRGVQAAVDTTRAP